MWTTIGENDVYRGLHSSPQDYQREFVLFISRILFTAFVSTETKVQSKGSGINFCFESPDCRSILRHHVISAFMSNTPAHLARICYGIMVDQAAIDSTKNEERNGNWTRLYTYSYRDSNGKPKTAHLSQYIIRDPHTGDSAALVFDMDPGRAL